MLAADKASYEHKVQLSVPVDGDNYPPESTEHWSLGRR